jgi:hypothetical protein
MATASGQVPTTLAEYEATGAQEVLRRERHNHELFVVTADRLAKIVALFNMGLITAGEGYDEANEALNATGQFLYPPCPTCAAINGAQMVDEDRETWDVAYVLGASGHYELNGRLRACETCWAEYAGE